MVIAPNIETHILSFVPKQTGKHDIDVYVMFDEVLTNAECILYIGSMTHTHYVRNKNFAEFTFRHFILAGIEIHLYVTHRQFNSIQNNAERTIITLRLLEKAGELPGRDMELFEDITNIIRVLTALESKVEERRDELPNCNSMKLTLQSMAYSGSAFRSLLEK